MFANAVAERMAGASAVRFSVVVPTFNRCASLAKTLDSLFRQDYGDVEIIVVNDGSTDGTHEYLQRLSSERKIVYVAQPNRGPAAARNAGIRKATGAYIACTDDDCIVPRNWLRSWADTFARTGVDVIGGAVVNGVANNIYSELSQDITNHFVRYLGADNRSSAFLTSNNVAYRADALQRVGGFDERFRRAGGEERALHERILSLGGATVFRPEVVIEHYHRLTARGFFRQQRNYGRGAYLLYHVVGREFRRPPTMMPVGAYTSLVPFLFRNGLWTGLKKTMLVGCAQCMSLIGYLSEMVTWYLAKRARA
jgi:glycosyltransferase involved in cell wall biosynthesis